MRVFDYVSYKKGGCVIFLIVLADHLSHTVGDVSTPADKHSLTLSGCLGCTF